MANTLYVSVNGSDAETGTDKPLASLSAALERSRQTGIKRIVVGPGRYFDVGLVLKPEDSGLTITGSGEGRTILYGGCKVENWQKDGHFLFAELPGISARDWDFRAFVVNDRLCPRARVPETGTFQHLSEFDVRWLSTTDGGWERRPTEYELTHMRYGPEDLDPWLDVNNAELTIFHCWDESLVGLSEVNREEHELAFRNPSHHPPGGFAGSHEQARTYVVWNVREGMKKPGQWYLDRSAGRLVYWPLPSETAENILAVAPTTGSIIRLAGTESEPITDVTISGLTLSATTTPLLAAGYGGNVYPGAIDGGHLRGCTFSDLDIRAVGGHGIRIFRFTDLDVSRCHVHHTGTGGIYCRSRGDGLTVRENYVHDVGLLFPSGIGISCSARHLVIQHNRIHDTTYSGLVSGGSPEGDISYNRFERVMTALRDGAAIYIFAGRRMRIHRNVVRDIDSQLGHGYYLDERSEGCIVENNLAVNCPWPSHNHMAKDCTIRNNVFISNGPMNVSLLRCRDFTFERNVLKAREQVSFTGPPNAFAKMQDNVIFSGEGRYVRAVTGMENYVNVKEEEFEAVDGTVLRDPMIEDSSSEHISYLPESPVSELGIKPHDFSGAGRLKTRRVS
ncbi:MAG: right-handed parallel beta-helix repeat-containing protein [Kiritimatiellia bacterium]